MKHAVILTGQVTHKAVLMIGANDLALFMAALWLRRNFADDRSALNLVWKAR